MTFRELARGVEIFDDYSDGDAFVEADHGFLRVSSTPPGHMTDRDAAELAGLGWVYVEGGRSWRHET